LRTEAIEIIRPLIDSIVIYKGANGPEIELVGDIGPMVDLALSQGSESKKAALFRERLF